MKTGKFFRFIIRGDELNPNTIKNDVRLSCDMFIKNETYLTGGLKTPVLQKTNRWAYRDEAQDETRVSTFLTKNLEVIANNISELRKYIREYKTSCELIVYAGNKTDISLTKKQIKLLALIGVDLSISFC